MNIMTTFVNANILGKIPFNIIQDIFTHNKNIHLLQLFDLAGC